MPRPITAMAAGVVLAFGIATSPALAEKKVNIGWTAWSDAEFITTLTKQILEERFDYEVELTLADIAIQYQGVARGDLDFMMMSWLPSTHQDYMEQVGTDVFSPGILYTDARLGWAIPDYIPEDELSSIEDLNKPEVRQQLGGRIQGIDPGAGLMRLSLQTIDDYGLDYELVSASGAGMTAALDRAIRRNEWIVVTGWSPHWKFGAYELRYLEDSKGSLGGAERVHVIARNGFGQEHPEVLGFLARMHLPLDELQSAMYEATQTSYEEAAAAYIENNPARIEYWVTGEIQ
ncbi:MAG: glycine betaine ABC transporter substrate-binding protein [Rhodospirillales bacterium]|nr:MAG: glycine betaine ABC transporter substrate-binding protein [Rhodospirillales bacterium]